MSDELKKLYDEIYLNEYIKDKPTIYQIKKLLPQSKINPYININAYKKSIDSLSPEDRNKFGDVFNDIDFNEEYRSNPGCGNTTMLMQFLLRYVKTQNYCGTFFRSTFNDLKMPYGIIERMHKWLDDTDAVFSKENLMWKFPKYNSMIILGYAGTMMEAYKYGGLRSQQIAFDGIECFDPSVKEYLLTNLRALKGSHINPRSIAIRNI
jgi:hypothetical protein